MIKVDIPLKLPSLNEYTDACRQNRYIGAKMKNVTESHILWYLHGMKKFEKPIKIHFVWQEQNKKRDPDNICFAKKFILDAMVKGKYIRNDNRNHIKAFTDDFVDGDEVKVTLYIEEQE